MTLTQLTQAVLLLVGQGQRITLEYKDRKREGVLAFSAKTGCLELFYAAWSMSMTEKQIKGIRSMTIFPEHVIPHNLVTAFKLLGCSEVEITAPTTLASITLRYNLDEARKKVLLNGVPLLDTEPIPCASVKFQLA